jgi:Phage terminase large subunit
MTETLTRQIKLRGAALEAMSCRAPEVLLAGAAGTGKSYGALMKAHMMMLANPGARALLVRKTHISLTQTGLVTFREQVLTEAIKTGLVHWYGGSSEKPAGYVYGNGSFVAVGGLDQAAKIMSSEYDLIFAQEATDLSKNDWELMTSRLRNGKVSFQQLLADCNPQHPSHWLHKRCQEGTTKLLTSLHEDNPRIVDDAGQLTEYGARYLAVLDNLTGVRYLRLRKGIWAAAEGIIYGDWRPEVHLRDRPEDGLPQQWTRIWTVDFGFVHPFVWQQWAVDPDGALWLEHEIHFTQCLVEDHAATILDTVAPKDETGRRVWRYPRPRVLLCDHDAEDRATLERHLGMGTTPAHKSVSDGIQAMQARLRVLGNGRSRMYVLRDALVERDASLADRGRPLDFTQEIEGYTWKLPPHSVGQDKPAPDEPNKVDDDSMDSARYAVAYLDLQPVPRIRWLG